ncbi:MAG: class I SAM-dependent methyltransferase [bacterium]|nr:class I SAM-dependent methyltransferase [bacterium]
MNNLRVKQEDITFSFGKNWQNMLKVVAKDDFDRSLADLNRWFDNRYDLKDKTIIDIGSGSGIHSLMFYSKNPAKLFSFDYDKNSVAATTSVWEKAGRPENWKVDHGSVLDKDYMDKLDKYDLVYSWGVLHHTGNMWEAIKNASKVAKPGGYFMLALYQDVKNYEYDIFVKKKYNAAGFLLKRWMEWSLHIWPLMKERTRNKKNPFKWNEKLPRGMNIYHDIVDWLGGLPYEVATEEELIQFLEPLKFTLVDKDSTRMFGTYLFQKTQP